MVRKLSPVDLLICIVHSVVVVAVQMCYLGLESVSTSRDASCLLRPRRDLHVTTVRLLDASARAPAALVRGSFARLG